MTPTRKNILLSVVVAIALISITVFYQSVVNVGPIKSSGADGCQRAYVRLLTQNSKDVHISYYSWTTLYKRAPLWKVTATSKDGQFKLDVEDVELCRVLDTAWSELETYNAYVGKLHVDNDR